MAREVFAVNHTITGGRSFATQDIITYKIQYPEFVSHMSLASLNRINAYYRESALTLARSFMSTHETNALADYYEHRRQGIPFFGYEMNRPFTITYGQDCVVSLYFDEYVFTGGAHGNTTRTSDTWNALHGRRIALPELFPQDFDYAQMLKALIVEEITARNAAEPGLYMDEYPALVEKAFCPNQFYLTPGELVLYFQQYDIAPYATGIPTFAFPYKLIGACVPGC